MNRLYFVTTDFTPDTTWRELDAQLAGERDDSVSGQADVAAWADAFAGERERGMDAIAPSIGRVWQRVQKSSSLSPSVSPVSARPMVVTTIPVRRRWTNSVAAFAVLLVCAGLAPFIWRLIQSPSSSLSQLYSTQRAQRAEFRLPDGTFVILGPETRMEYRGAARSGRRLVHLEGQAYFVVSQASERPFLVEAGGTATQVLGTSFTVRAYPTDRGVAVAVAEGKVQFGQASSTVVLTAGDIGRVVDGTSPVMMHGASVTDVLGWTQGKITFTDVLFEDIVPELERLYDLDIRVTDSALLRQRVTVMLAGESVDEMLHTVIPAVDASHVRRGQIVTVTARRLKKSS